jgi:hypothetical protein
MSVFAAGDVTLVDVLLGFALIAVIPLAFGLDRLTARLRGAATVAGCLAMAGLALRRDVAVAAALGAPWLIITLVAALLIIRRWWRGERAWAAVARPVAFAYLAFGAAWLVLDLADARPLRGRAAVHRARRAAPLLCGIHDRHAGHSRGLLGRASRPAQAAAMVSLVLAGPPDERTRLRVPRRAGLAAAAA